MKEEKRVSSLDELKKLCNEGYKEFYVLSGGMLRGSREISYNEEDKNIDELAAEVNDSEGIVNSKYKNPKKKKNK